MTEYVPIALTLLGLLGTVAWFIHQRGQVAGREAALLAAAGEKLTESATRISNLPQLESSVLSLTSIVRQNHEEDRDRFDKQDSAIAKLASHHAGLKAELAGLDAKIDRKVSYRALRIPTGTDFSVEAAAAALLEQGKPR